jgi:hypothetical protein
MGKSLLLQIDGNRIFCIRPERRLQVSFHCRERNGNVEFALDFPAQSDRIDMFDSPPRIPSFRALESNLRFNGVVSFSDDYHA